jgi:hypothetical protein
MTDRNMYGCLPCPACGSVYRYPFREGGTGVVCCDACGRRGPWDGGYRGPHDEVDELESSCSCDQRGRNITCERCK